MFWFVIREITDGQIDGRVRTMDGVNNLGSDQRMDQTLTIDATHLFNYKCT